ncbi:phosphotransferase [Opitutaceae bacterium EW11]|nr:phosphotransferase [Opitutaceae bacterium EW11]
MAGAADHKPDLVLKGTLTRADHQTYRTVPFRVPEGVERITVAFAYSGRDQHTTVDLGLLGPDGFRGKTGFRGWSGGNKSVFTVSAVDATPSYLPTPIVPGEWNLLLGIPNLRAGVQSDFTAEIYFSRSLAVADEPAIIRPVLQRETRWYRGDLHAHTAHSDGWTPGAGDARIPSPVFLAARQAAERGLDFVVITDHNTGSGANSLRELQPYYDHLLLVPGREITTFEGHGNAIGTNAQIDFRVGNKDTGDWNAVLAEIAASGAFFSVNHPIRPSGEACLGCGWTPRNPVDWAQVQGVEVVNGDDADTAYSGIPFWHELLNRGLRLVGIGGSDTHEWSARTAGPAGGPGIGHPTTLVHAASLSTVDLLDGLRSGRVQIDVSGSGRRWLEFSAVAGATKAEMGGTLTPAPGSQIAFSLSVFGCTGGRVEVWRDGEKVPALQQEKIAGDSGDFAFTTAADDRPHWWRIDVRDASGKLLLIGNPIFLRPGRG